MYVSTVCVCVNPTPGFVVMGTVVEEIIDGVVVELHIRHKHGVVPVLVHFSVCLADLRDTQDVTIVWHLGTGETAGEVGEGQGR